MEQVLKGAYNILPMDKVIYGPDSVKQVASEVDRLGGKRAFIVTVDPLVKETELVQKIQEILGNRYVGTYADVVQHVPRLSVIEGAKAAREAGADILISVGGGSPIDSAKAIALCLAEGLTEASQLDNYMIKFQNPDMLEVPSMKKQAIPHISISTTLSVAEFTNIVGITDEERKAKDLYQDNKLLAKVVILDPEMTITTPAWLWASTAMRAMDHAVEGVYSKSHMPVTDALGLMAISMLFKYLPTSIKDPQNVGARGQCQVAGWLSIYGLTNVMMGISHGIGHQLGARCNVPHGVTSCLMLPHAMEFNRPVTADCQAMIARAMGVDTKGMTDEEASKKAVETMFNFIRDLGVAPRLRDWGVKETDLDAVADETMQDMAVVTNPRPVTRADAIELLMKAW